MKAVLDCFFCRQPFNQGRKGEDLIPDWYSKAIGRPTSGEVVLGTADESGMILLDPVRTQTVSAMQFRVPDVCPSCNNTWMSTIDEAAKPILLPMMEGRNVTLSGSDLRTVAEWVQLKGILWDHLQKPSHLHPSLGPGFYRQRPIRDLAVVIGMVSPSSPMDVAFANRMGRLAMPLPGGDTWVARVTIRFNHLVMQTSRVIDGYVPVEFLRDTAAPFVGAWPPGPQGSALVTWPPTSVTVSELREHL